MANENPTNAQDNKATKPTKATGPITYNEFALMATERLVGIGPKRKAGMASIGIRNLLDLLFCYPRRYIDRRNQAMVSGLAEGEEATVLVEVRNVSSRRTRSGKTMTTIDTADETGSLRVTFFNQPWRAKQLSVSKQVILFGKCEIYRGYRQMTSPIVDLVGNQTGRIIPVYPNSEKAKIGTAELSSAIGETMRRSALRSIADPLDQTLLDRHDLVSRRDALHWIHLPETMAQVAQARKRLIFDELLRMQVALVRTKNRLAVESVGIAHNITSVSETTGIAIAAPGTRGPVSGDGGPAGSPGGGGSASAGSPADAGNSGGGLVAQFFSSLEFELTSAQKEAITQIAADMAKPSPMHRLLQGDVGAGKTLVALAAVLIAIQGGHQGAIMAPTEVLAEQHYAGIRRLLSQLTVESDGTLFSHRPLRVSLLTNSTTAAQRKRLSQELKEGHIDLLVGTHALIQDSVAFASLGVVVIDEQHRFGVEQRAALRSKGSGDTIPDVLVMTATPIPRTAAMTVYGDLDVSVLDELPPGRTPIETIWVKSSSGLTNSGSATQSEKSTEALADMWQKIREQIAAGRQAYIVTPLVEESDKIEAASAQETFDELTETELAGLRVGLLHGRIAAADKEATMEAFRIGELDVLIATTVIEVGVDVGNATVMAILDAHRFGIAQLHQLRGRVGRSTYKSICYLVSDAGQDTDPEKGWGAGQSNSANIAAQRLEALVASTDGFELAEIDLELRGEGTIMGQNQKGRSDLRLASLRKDRYWVQLARQEAIALLETDPELQAHNALRTEIELLLDQESTEYLFKS